MSSLRRLLTLIALFVLANCSPASKPDLPKQAQRVLLICVDNQRADHTGIYGATRDTTPALDAFAHTGIAFDHALTPAPWVLPAMRAVLTGRQPEEYDSATTLPELLRERGFATAMFSANPWLSARYDMQRGFDLFQVAPKASAAVQVDQVIEWLHQNSDRNVLLVLHLADAQLPFREPASHRHLFAGDPVPPLGESLTRSDLLGARLANPMTRAYVAARYDNNLRYADDQLARLFAAVGNDDIVVYFSDHGEELWDRGRFGHARSLAHEVLHVPLVIRAPGFEPGRIPPPVSLVDITPTLIDLLDLDPSEHAFDGTSLVPAMGGEPDAFTRLGTRSIAFGRPLYGARSWGVQTGLEKYITVRGIEMLYDLATDPHESSNLLAGREWSAGLPFRRRLAEALGRQIKIGFVLTAFSSSGLFPKAVEAHLEFDGGVASLWVADQPANAALSWAWTDQGRAFARWEAGFREGHQIIVMPRKTIGAAERSLTLDVSVGERSYVVPVSLDASQRSGTRRQRLAAARLPEGLVITLDACVAPIPGSDTGRMPGPTR